MMPHTLPQGVQPRTLKTSPVLRGIVDDQLREAAWSTMARLRQLADAQGSVAAVQKREHYLRGHMAGLASVFDGRLCRRLQHILVDPEELVTEAFVAALLLLRCDRTHSEHRVIAAWKNATCTLQRKHIGMAMVHGGLADPNHHAMLLDLLTCQDIGLRHAASDVVGNMGLYTPAAHAAVGALQSNHDDVLCMLLRLMTHGVWPVDSSGLAAAATHKDSDIVSALEHVLAVRTPQMLIARTRARLDGHAEGPPTLLGLEAMAATLAADSAQGQADLARLQSLCRDGRIGPLALQALALTHLPDAATIALQTLSQCGAQPGAQAALQTFTTITGVQQSDGAHDVPAGYAPLQHAAEALQRAWRNLRHRKADNERLFFGQSLTAASYLHHLPKLHVGRWHSMLRGVAMRSAGAIVLPTWPLVERHKHQVLACAPRMDAIWRAKESVSVACAQAPLARTHAAARSAVRYRA